MKPAVGQLQAIKSVSLDRHTIFMPLFIFIPPKTCLSKTFQVSMITYLIS